MMKSAAKMVMLVLGVATCSLVWADHHKTHKHAGWFDAAECDICKPWSEHAELMQSTKWETHTIANGMLMVALVPEEQMKTFAEVCSKMDMATGKLAAGGKPEGLCGFCDSMGQLMQAGVKMEKVKTGFGNITVVTADSPEMVAKIHAVAKRSQEEAKKMLAAISAAN